MKLFEFEAKNILRKYGIATPEGDIASNSNQAELVAREIGKPVVLKAQVTVSGRGKAGGIVSANSASEAREAASSLIGSKIKGAVVKSLLVEEKVEIAGEFYASVAIDRQARKYVVLASTSGGVDIEQVALASPDKISRYQVDPLAGFSKDTAEAMVAQFSNMDRDDAARFSSILDTLYTIAMDCDAELVEINPLVRTASGEFAACDARIIVDDNALFRHPEFEDRDTFGGDYTPREVEARKQKLAYVDLDGDIGIIGNGAGLVMATLDLVQLFGGKPANFLDIGGGAQAEVIRKAVKLVMSKPEVRAVLLNILGGVTRCDIVAQGVIEALNESEERKPLAVRMIGTNEEAGTRMLQQAGVHTCSSMEEAIKEVLRL
jgi:succinyl-CoA synthetase beta subunit